MYQAIYQDDPAGAFEVPHRTDAYCPECGERVRVWREAENGTARHFKHVSNFGGNGGGGTNCGGGESDEHRKWKNFAGERLQECFPEANTAEVKVEKDLHAVHTDKDGRSADAAIMFDTYDRQLGNGLAVEVQHKNKDKDIAATTLDYTKQDIAVAWLDESDFSKKGCRMNEADFRQRARDAVSINIFGNPVPWSLHIRSHVEPTLDQIRNARETLEGENNLKARDWKIPATIPLPAVDEIQYRESDWEAIFTGHAEDHFRTQAITHGPTSTLPNPTMPPVFRDTIEYKNTEWERLFADYPESHHTTQASIPAVDSRKTIPATIIERWLDTRHYRTNSWAALFDNPADGFLTGLTATTPRVEILLPPEYAEKHREELHTTWKLAGGNYDLDLLYRLKENNAPRRCADCGSDADYYLFEDGIVSEYRCEQHLLIPTDAAAD